MSSLKTLRSKLQDVKVTEFILTLTYTVFLSGLSSLLENSLRMVRYEMYGGECFSDC